VVPAVVVPLACFFYSIYAFDKRVKQLFPVTIGLFFAWLVITAIYLWLGLYFGIGGAHTIWPLSVVYLALSVLVVWVLRSKSLTLRSRSDRPEAAGC
jgi:membrane protein YdbS with pleckstrin-like domain